MASYAGGVVDACDIYEVFDVDLDKPWQLLSHYFPDKIGGRPAWLSLNPLPTPDDVKCGRCKRPCALLLQKYAPKETLHRTIFVFMCREPECCRPDTNDNFVVLRSQLPFVNDFYSVDPPVEDFFDMSSDYPRACKWTPLCAVCGCSGPKQCGKCRRINYCSREHQTVDWTSGHKSECSGSSSELKQRNYNRILFPEFVIDIPEESSVCSGDLSEDDADLKNYSVNTDNNFSTAELEQMAKDSMQHEDKLFEEFKKVTKQHPNQVLRYNRGGSPLWVTDNHTPQSGDIPPCERCGAARQFEFQVMPQLLNHLSLDDMGSSIDWATLAIFTCSVDCEAGGKYGREFLWKQDYKHSHPSNQQP